MNVVDLTAKAPTSYRRCMRKAESITTIVIHAAGFSWKPTNPMWAKVKAHYVVLLNGTIIMNHDPLVRMKYGSSVANPYSITIEHEGNPVNENGHAFMPEKFGVHKATPEQVAASRELITYLCDTYPSIQHVSAHRHIEAGKSNCPGLQLWSEIGEWSMMELGLHEAPVLKTGLALPEAWRAPPVM